MSTGNLLQSEGPNIGVSKAGRLNQDIKPVGKTQIDKNREKIKIHGS